MEGKQEDRQKKNYGRLVLPILFITLIAVTFAMSGYQTYEEIENPKEKEWPEVKTIGEDDQYTYYSFNSSHARYDKALAFIGEQGGIITLEEDKVNGWWTFFEYKVSKEVSE